MKLDFERMLSEGVLESHPELRRYPEFTTTISDFPEQAHGKVLLYAFLVYHKNSPLSDSENVEERKALALRETGLGRLKAVTEKVVNDLFTLNNPEFQAIVSMVLRLGRDRKWERLVSSQEALRQVLIKIRQPVDPYLDDDKSYRSYRLKAELVDDAAKIDSDIDALEKEFYQGDEQLQEVLESGNDLEASDIKGGIAERMVNKANIQGLKAK